MTPIIPPRPRPPTLPASDTRGFVRVEDLTTQLDAKGNWVPKPVVHLNEHDRGDGSRYNSKGEPIE